MAYGNRVRHLGGAVAFALFATFGMAGPGWALTPQTANGIAYLSGGIGMDERAEMQKVRNDYSLLVTISAKTGEYLGRARVTIVGANDAIVLETTMDGPMLLVNLRPGKYALRVNSGAVTKMVTTTIGANGHSEAALVWDVDVPN